MPIYELRCNKCGMKFEELLKGLSRLGQDIFCPGCKTKDVSRMFSVFSMRNSASQHTAVGGYSSSNKCSGCSGTSCSSCGG